jgi:hypothetical protein
MAPIIPVGPRDRPYPGGTPTTGGSGSSGVGVFVPTSFGGVLATRQIALYPVLNVANNQMEYRTFDVGAVPNDKILPSSYSWRVEQANAYQQYTIRRIIWTFTDLGQVTATWTLTGVNDAQQVISASTALGVGNNPATGRIMTVPVDILLVGLNMQLSVSRNANDGPLSVLSVLMITDIPQVTL